MQCRALRERVRYKTFRDLRRQVPVSSTAPPRLYMPVTAITERNAAMAGVTPGTDATDEAVRDHNRAIVAQYMNTRGQSRLTRHELFTEDGVGGLWTTDSGEPIVIRGRDRLVGHAVWSLRCFPDWVW